MIDNKENDKQCAIQNVSKFDMEKFKEYVATYDQSKHGLDKPNVIVKDMIYVIGICVDEKEFSFADGYKKFTTFLKSFL
jgi:hypothetical protein